MGKHTITRDQIAAQRPRPCSEGLLSFDAAYPDGVATYDPTSAEDAAQILGGPMAKWWGWAVDSGVAVPFLLSCGDNGTATAGYMGTATAGYGCTATAGEGGTIVISHFDGRRRLVVGYIGETLDASGQALEPGVAYHLDSEGRFVRA